MMEIRLHCAWESGDPETVKLGAPESHQAGLPGSSCPSCEARASCPEGPAAASSQCPCTRRPQSQCEVRRAGGKTAAGVSRWLCPGRECGRHDILCFSNNRGLSGLPPDGRDAPERLRLHPRGRPPGLLPPAALGHGPAARRHRGRRPGEAAARARGRRRRARGLLGLPDALLRVPRALPAGQHVGLPDNAVSRKTKIPVRTEEESTIGDSPAPSALAVLRCGARLPTSCGGDESEERVPGGKAQGGRPGPDGRKVEVRSGLPLPQVPEGVSAPAPLHRTSSPGVGGTGVAQQVAQHPCPGPP
ncbi:aryl hydrocarbon receptor repressor isoform X5 [Mustela putorius furo]|uniref:Aryl hydrocarbon receptor repressor isoform X5 n=1 Tax=Mustela putorius furo TaxID=9669 RepID=A0A8U0SNY4_MUSPF|nr:aryl hydrocarbon receptor repressor isoform X5 [Mustela putorius furo]